jgi:hypothetical protein
VLEAMQVSTPEQDPVLPITANAGDSLGSMPGEPNPLMD